MNDSFLESFIQSITEQQETTPYQSIEQLETHLYTLLLKHIYNPDISQELNNPTNPSQILTVISQTNIRKELVSQDLKSMVIKLERVNNKIKYPIAMIIVFLLTVNKEKSLSIILGFYYEILNNFIKEISNESRGNNQNKNNVVNPTSSLESEKVSALFCHWMMKIFESLIAYTKRGLSYESIKREHDYQLISKRVLDIHMQHNSNSKAVLGIFKSTKVYKTISSLLCLPEALIPVSSLLHIILQLHQSHPQSNEILSKLEYKLVSKLEQYNQNLFKQNEVVLMFRILLHGFNPRLNQILSELFSENNIEPIKQKKSTENNQSTFSSELWEDKHLIKKLIDCLAEGMEEVDVKQEDNKNQTNIFGYHLTCFIIKTISRESFLNNENSNSELNLLKQIIFYILTQFLHPLFSSLLHRKSVKFYNTIISTLISESDVFILKICLNFIQNESVSNFTVHKLKSLFKLLTDIAKKLKKMECIGLNKSNSSIGSEKEISENNENLKQKKKRKLKEEQQLMEEVELAKLKISRILRILDELSQRFKDKNPEILFENGKESFLNLNKIKSTHSLIFSIRLYNKEHKSLNLRNSSINSNNKNESLRGDEIRLVQFILGKSEIYEIFLKIKPTNSIKIDSSSEKNENKSSISIVVESSKNILDEIISSDLSSYSIEILICQDRKIIIREELKNVPKVADSFFEFSVCVTCNKLTESKGTNLFIKINEKLMMISSKIKRNEITSLEFGNHISKESTYPTKLQSHIKQMYLFNKEIPEILLTKNDFSFLSFSINSLLQFIGGLESINYKISSTSEELIENFKKQDSIFFKNELKINQASIQKIRSISFIEIFQQIGGLNSIFYILEKINKSYATHFGEKTQYFFIEIFKILKNIGANDRENFIFKELKNCYSYIFRFLILIFKRNEHLANQRNSLFVEAIFKFIMFFSSHFTKNETIKQYPLEEVLEMELTFIKEILCNFELWSECSIEIQSYVFETLQSFIKNERYSYILFPIDIHSKILSSVTFFYSSEPFNVLKNKFEQRILSVCEILYDKVINILFDEKNNLEGTYNLELLFNILKKMVTKEEKEDSSLISKKQNLDKHKTENKPVTTRKDLISMFERYVHRDVNQIIGLINLLIIYHKKHFHEFLPTSNKDSKQEVNLSPPKEKKENPKLSTSSLVSNKKSFLNSTSNNTIPAVYLPESLRTCSNLIAYFSKNFIEKQEIFMKINEDWSFVLGILTEFLKTLLSIRVQSKQLSEKTVSKISYSCEFSIFSKIFQLILKIVQKSETFFNYLINCLEKLLMFEGIEFLESFEIAAEILSLNKKYNFEIVDTIFFLLNKKLNLLQKQNEKKEIIEFLTENELEKILYKMADPSLTESKEFIEFMINVQKEISLNFNHKIENKFIESDKIDEQKDLEKIFELYEDVLFSICYETGSISQRNKDWMENYFERNYQQPKTKYLIQRENLLKGKRINELSNILIAYYCSSEATIPFVFDVFEKIRKQEVQEAQEESGSFVVSKNLKESLTVIEEKSPKKEDTNSYHSKVSEYRGTKEELFIESEDKINENISLIIEQTEQISFFLSHPELAFEEIILFNRFLSPKVNGEIENKIPPKIETFSTLRFIKQFIFGSSLNYLIEKYSFKEENLSEIEKPIDATKRKEITLEALSFIGKCMETNEFSQQTFYNCLLSESEINAFTNEKVIIKDKDNLTYESRKKLEKEIKNNLKKFLENTYINTHDVFKINLLDKSQIKTPKKLNLEERNIYDNFFDKLKFICFEVSEDDQKINELFNFLSENTQKSNAKKFQSFMNKTIFTLKYFIESKYLLCVLQNYELIHKENYPIGCPKNPAQILTENMIFEYRSQVTKNFNKILEAERKKGEKSEKEYKKNEKENEFWLEIEEKEFEKKDVIYEIDEKEMGPFGFYKLNIKPSEDRVEQIHYPRKKMFASIKDSETSQENEQEENNENEESLLLSRTKLIEITNENDNDEGKNRRRNTLLNFTQIENGMEKNSLLTNGQSNKNSVQFYCEWVTKRGVYGGNLVVKQEWLEFKYLSHLRFPDEPVFRLSTGKFHQINSLTEDENLFISSLKISFKRCKMFTRRYILRHTAVELFSKANHQSYFFNLFFTEQREKFILLTKERFEECLEDRRQEFIRKQFTEQWQIGMLSNFEYLCLINQYSGRSTNDLAQYYVFPWVISNFNGKDGYKEFNDEFLLRKENMRDLSCPPGKLNEEKFTKLKMRLMELDFCEPEERFLYGTMFSNPTVLYNFFIRLEPYIHLHWEHQGKRIDHADRLFSSIEEQFSSVLIASSDMKELTHEFYYWPEFLKNRSYIDLGLKQNKQAVDDVILPVWAHTPEEFIFKMRYALESNFVSEHLNEWIDLTFGYKVKYENAEKFDNLYHFNCYEREIDYFEEFNGNEKEIRSLQVSISEFGQIPEAIFDEPHPHKNIRFEFLILDKMIHVKYDKSSPKTLEMNFNRGFETCKEGLFVWTSSTVEFKKSYINQNYSFDEEYKVFPSTGGLARLLSFEDQCWLTLSQGILRIYLKRVLRYESNIEAQCVDVIGTYFIYSKKSSLFVGQYDGAMNRIINRKTLFGHKDEIIYLMCCKELDLILSVDLEGFVIIHELQNLSFLRHFQLPLEKEWCKNDTKGEKLQEKRLKVQIHEMGYFIFLLNQRKLVVMTFLGEKFLEHDIEITSEIKGRKEEEKINDMLIFRHDQSKLLLATDKGNIYEIDFIEIKRYNEIYPHKTFTNIRNNILELFLEENKSTMKKSHVSKKSFSGDIPYDKAIERIAVEKIAGDKITMYQLIVQYENGLIVCFYEEKYLGKQLKQNEKLKQIGLFF